MGRMAEIEWEQRSTQEEEIEMEYRTVTIPRCAEHEGFYAMDVTLPWVCPVCGGPRGEPFETISFDGSRRLGVHGWRNDCGHIDYYGAVRDEYRAIVEK